MRARTVIASLIAVGGFTLLGGSSVRAGGGACIDDAVGQYKECQAQCKEDYQTAKDACLNRDHDCVEVCRAKRDSCVQDSGLPAALDACNATLHDANGRFLPLYIQMPQIGTDTWFHPMLVYVTAVFLKVLPLSEWALRLPTVFVGLVDIALMYFLARRVFGSRTYGWFAAALLALTPAHFIHSRFALDYIYPVPFTLLWLWCVVRFEQGGDRRVLFGAGLALGIGFYSYIGAVMLMPIYFLLTLCYIVVKYRRADRALCLLSIGFVLPLTVLLFWLVKHPTLVDETIARYGVSGQSKLHSLRALVRYPQLQEYIAQYWNLNNPVYLFFVGSSNWVDSTRRAGVFLVAIFLPP